MSEILYKTGNLIKLIDIANYSLKNSSFYRDYDICKVEDYLGFSKLPTLSKEKYVSNWNEFVADEISINDLLIDYTSGSTGKPVKVARTQKELTSNQLKIWKLRKKHYNNIVSCKRAEFARRTRYFLDNPNETHLIDKNVMYLKGVLSNELINEHISLLEKYQPEFIISAPSFIWEFVCKAKTIKCLNFTPKLIECSGEYMYDYMRKDIELYFNCKVINHYGASEFWPIAFDNLDYNLEINGEEVFVEIINPDPEGFGQIIITPLKLYSIPLLRYEIGDVGRILAPSNTNSYGILELKNAKVTDYAITQDGRRIGGFYFSEIFVNNIHRRGLHGINSWQVVQEELLKFKVILSINPDYESKVENIIISNIKEQFGNVSVEFQYVNNIERNNNGKMKYFINNIK